MDDALSDIPGTNGVPVPTVPVGTPPENITPPPASSGHPSTKTLLLSASILFLTVAVVVGGIFVFRQQNLSPKAQQASDPASCQAQGGVVRDGSCQGSEVPIGTIDSGGSAGGSIGGGDGDTGRQQLCCRAPGSGGSAPITQIQSPPGSGGSDKVSQPTTPPGGGGSEPITRVPTSPPGGGSAPVTSVPQDPPGDTSTQCPDPTKTIIVTVSCLSCKQ